MTWPFDYNAYFETDPAREAVGRRGRVLARLGSSCHPEQYLPLRDTVSAHSAPSYNKIPDSYDWKRRDPSLHPALQDLANMIVWDLHEACDAMDDPNLWYPGVDDGIEPVTDEHVELVIWATQRELRRELRPMGGEHPRPAVEIADLPWHIQRAFVERRRLRYQEWGITREHWHKGVWRALDVPEDDWKPPWEDYRKT